MQSPVKVTIWSDVQCVWCYISDARWKRALDQFDRPVEIVHRSFELQPGFPAEFDAQAYLRANRGMDDHEQERVFSAMKRTAAAEGLGYEPEKIRPTNSHLALELLHYADTVGRYPELSDRLYTAYFAEGRHIGSVDSLVELAGEVGLDPTAARAALESGRFVDAVDQDSAQAHALGARGVPFTVINDAYVIPGALDTAALVAALNEVVRA